MTRFTASSYLYLPASLLDEQEYCEVRLHYKIIEGKAGPLKPGEARRIVQRVAFKLSDSTFSGVSGFKKVRVAGEIFGVPVAASPDAALVSGGVVTALLRGRIRDPPRTYESDYTRLLAAAYLLEQLGRLAEDARLAVVVGRNPASLKKLVESIAAAGLKPLKSDEGLVEVRVYRGEEAASLLNHLMAYWRGEREPTPRPSPGKCVTCNYALQCPHAAIPRRGRS